MVLEVVLEVIFPVIGRILGFIFLELLTHAVFYTVGFVFLKIITLGKYPDEFISPKSDLHQQTYVYLMGWVIFLALIIIWLV